MVTGALLVSPGNCNCLIYETSVVSITNHNLTVDLQVDEEQKPMSYTQAFQLLPDGAGSYFVLNDIFRLVYPAS